jgi:glycosyltransferase involved in cell wall biosynthesis
VGANGRQAVTGSSRQPPAAPQSDASADEPGSAAVAALVTIVVPVYNYAEYLEECLNSVVAQTRACWELVVVDDGSTVGDAEAIVRAIGDERIRLVRHARNRGLAAARNTGVKAGSGELIVPLDADDCLAPTYLAEVIDALEARPGCDAAFTDFVAFGAWNGPLPYDIRDVAALMKEQWIPGPGTLFRRALWDDVGGYCEADTIRLGNEDWDFWLNAAKRGLQVTHVARPLYLYRQHADSMVNRQQYHEHLTREFVHDRHRDLFARYGMANVFLSGGYFSSAKAHWQKRERRQAIRLGARSFALSPADCLRSVVDQAIRLLRPRRAVGQAVDGP